MPVVLNLWFAETWRNLKSFYTSVVKIEKKKERKQTKEKETRNAIFISRSLVRSRDVSLSLRHVSSTLASQISLIASGVCSKKCIQYVKGRPWFLGRKSQCQWVSGRTSDYSERLYRPRRQVATIIYILCYDVLSKP